jgi:predicted HicB family RNase H-like nuclease
MLTNLLSYKGYFARISFDPSADAFHGRVIGLRDVIDFYGRTPDELRDELRVSVDDYLAWCAEEGTKPEKTWQGKLTLRIGENLRNRITVAAAARDASINAWITEVLDRETRRVLEDHEPFGSVTEDDRGKCAEG